MRRQALRSLALASVLGAASVGMAAAQVAPGLTPPPSSPIPRAQPEAQPQIAPPLATPEPSPAAEEGPAVEIAGIEVIGVTIYPSAEVDSIFARLKGGSTHQGDVAEAVRQLQLKYRNDGYLLTKVVGTLKPAGGAYRLEVRATEGFIADIKIEGDVGPVATLVYDTLQHLTGIRPVRIADIERYVLLAQRIPGITIHTILRPAKDEPGAVELVAELALKHVEGQVADDNRGPRTAGPNELLAGISTNSFTGLGERAELLLFDTPVDDEQLFGQGSVDWAIGSDGLRAKVYAGYGAATPGDVLRIVGYRSRLLTFGGALSYPEIVTRALSLATTAAYDVDRSEIDLLGFDGGYHRLSNSHIQVVRLGEQLTFQDAVFGADRLGATTAELKVHQGIGPRTDSLYPARPGEVGDFIKYTGEVRRTQGLQAWGATSLDVLFSVIGQWTPQTLPPSEKLFLGGYQYGRGFFNGEVTGDRAVAGTVELQLNDQVDVPLVEAPLTLGLQYYAFYDVGQTWDRSQGSAPLHIESTGVGIRATVTEHLSIEVEGVERFTRRPLGSDTVDLEPEHAAYFRVVARY